MYYHYTRTYTALSTYMAFSPLISVCFRSRTIADRSAFVRVCEMLCCMLY